jgi:dienelactone hydrolase
VVLIHGCNGYDWQVRGQPGWTLAKAYARRYVAHGYAALVLDSFEPRGIAEACGAPMTVTPTQRAWDALSAARYLMTRADIDPRRLVLQGDSHGGLTVLWTLRQGAPGRSPFAAGIAFYPGCIAASGFTAPILILIGDKDDWTPALRCERMVRTLESAGHHEVELKVFPGVTHAFDFPMQPHTNALGHFLAHDAAATVASWQAIDAFLSQVAGAR